MAYTSSNVSTTGAQYNRLEAVKRFQDQNMKTLKSLDEVVQLASEICEAPVAYVSLIDDTRQQFIAKKGLEAESLVRSQSFCNETVQQTDLIVIEDLRKHPAYSKNPSVSGAPHIRFYAGMPVQTYSGENIGTICVIDVKPKSLSAYQRETLKMLSSHVVYLLELQVALDEVSEQKKIVDSDALLKEKLVAQNRQVKSMAQFLAHQVSGPVASMKGLMHLIGNLPYEEGREYLPLMDLVIEQMDEAVRLVAASAFDAVAEDLD